MKTRSALDQSPIEEQRLPSFITKLNKQIASDLGTGEQTVKIHRGRMMHKMGLESVADLVRIAEKLGIGRKVD